MLFKVYRKIFIITDSNTVYIHKNIHLNDCVKDVKIEQNNFDDTNTIENNITIERNKSMVYSLGFF